MTKIKRQKIINDICKHDADPPLTRRAYRQWLWTLKSQKLAEYYLLAQLENPSLKSAQSADSENPKSLNPKS